MALLVMYKKEVLFINKLIALLFDATLTSKFRPVESESTLNTV